MSTRHGLIRAVVADVWNSGSFEHIAAVLSPGFIYYSPVFGHGLRGVQAFKDYVLTVREGLPDFTQTLIGEPVGDGDRIAVHWVMEGRHTGDFLGIAPTGKTIRLEGADIYRFLGDQIVEIRSFHDQLTVMQQLGMLPQQEDTI